MFLAAATSLQGSIFYFIMYAFNRVPEAASSLTGTLTSVIGIFIIITAIFSGWIANWVGRRRLVWISGIVAALGNVLLLVTIWVPQLTIVYAAGTIIGIATGLFMTANWALGTDLVPRGRSRALPGHLEPGRSRRWHRRRRHRRTGGGCHQPLLHGVGLFCHLRRLCGTVRLECCDPAVGKGEPGIACTFHIFLPLSTPRTQKIYYAFLRELCGLRGEVIESFS